jgi:ferritin-like metal-binding protein YciE
MYETAFKCVMNADLKKECKKYLDQTRNHDRILTDVFKQLGLDPQEDSPGRQVIKLLGEALVQAMNTALKAGNPKHSEPSHYRCDAAKNPLVLT